MLTRKIILANFALYTRVEMGDVKDAHKFLAVSCLLHVFGKYTLIEKVRHGVTIYVFQSHTLYMTILYI